MNGLCYSDEYAGSYAFVMYGEKSMKDGWPRLEACLSSPEAFDKRFHVKHTKDPFYKNCVSIIPKELL